MSGEINSPNEPEHDHRFLGAEAAEPLADRRREAERRKHLSFGLSILGYSHGVRQTTKYDKLQDKPRQNSKLVIYTSWEISHH